MSIDIQQGQIKCQNIDSLANPKIFGEAWQLSWKMCYCCLPPLGVQACFQWLLNIFQAWKAMSLEIKPTWLELSESMLHALFLLVGVCEIFPI